MSLFYRLDKNAPVANFGDAATLLASRGETIHDNKLLPGFSQETHTVALDLCKKKCAVGLSRE